jgi:hypothetical protein
VGTGLALAAATIFQVGKRMAVRRQFGDIMAVTAVLQLVVTGRSCWRKPSALLEYRCLGFGFLVFRLYNNYVTLGHALSISGMVFNSLGSSTGVIAVVRNH